MICLDNKIRDIIKVDRSLACCHDDGGRIWFSEDVMYIELSRIVDLKKS